MPAESGKAPSVFVEAQRPLLTSILNRIIPAGGEFPGAGDLGVATYLDAAIAPSPDLKRLFTQGLAQIEIVCRVQYTRAFTELSESEQDAILRHAESTDPEFFGALILHTYSGYYTNPKVIPLLGLEGLPPQPRGYHLEPLDPHLLDRVRQRGPLYREA